MRGDVNSVGPSERTQEFRRNLLRMPQGVCGNLVSSVTATDTGEGSTRQQRDTRFFSTGVPAHASFPDLGHIGR
jgi:hypothetical protein